MALERLSLAEARRVALAALGFDRPRPAKPGLAHVRRVLRQLGVVQLDFVNVLVPAHYLVLFSRLGPYRRELFDRLASSGGGFTEQWAHEASVVPVETWPLLEHRREEFRLRPWGIEDILSTAPGYLERVLEEVRGRGPLVAAELAEPDGHQRRIEKAWHSLPRATLEAHFGRGGLAVSGRRPNFAREYDLAERVIPAEFLERQVDRETAHRELLAHAARAHGIGVAADLADYYRLKASEARPRLAELEEQGVLKRVEVEGWREPAWRHRDAKLPARVDACALLSPFDPLVWFRPRLSRLFEFDYTIEIYTPAAKRRWGYYVLPFLLGDRLVGRVDLKANRKASRLEVLSVHWEAGRGKKREGPALAGELDTLARWLGLEQVTTR
jgi:uncharacterized protein YcaQ